MSRDEKGLWENREPTVLCEYGIHTPTCKTWKCTAIALAAPHVVPEGRGQDTAKRRERQEGSQRPHFSKPKEKYVCFPVFGRPFFSPRGSRAGVCLCVCVRHASFMHFPHTSTCFVCITKTCPFPWTERGPSALCIKTRRKKNKSDGPVPQVPMATEKNNNENQVESG